MGWNGTGTRKASGTGMKAPTLQDIFEATQRAIRATAGPKG